MTPATTIPAPPLVTVTVNGVERQFPKGKNLLQALLDVDVEVPHYCYHPSLSVAGNCRLCLIEIVGQPRPGISCNMTCTDGLDVNTESELAKDCQRGMMEFLLVNHPLDCPICDRGGECMLQRYSMDYGTGHARTADERRRFEKPDFDPLIDIERNRCILCTRCVRFMDEVGGEHKLAIYGRGNRNYIGTYGDGPVTNVFSGNIIDICPVGCLTSKPYRFSARPWEMQQVASTCTLCSAGCPVTAWLRDGRVYRVTPPVRKYNGAYTIDEDTTRFICNEGRFGNYFANSPDRLLKALRREGEGQVECGLEEAIASAAAMLKEAAETGPERVAVLAGARSTNEECFALARLARVTLGTGQIDWRLSFASARGAEAAGRALAGSDGDLEALERGEYEATLIVGGDLRETAPVVALKLRDAARLNQTKLAMIGPRADGWLSNLAEGSKIVAPEALAAAMGDAEKQIEAILDGAESGLLVLDLDLAGGEFNAGLVDAAFALLARLGAGWKFLPVTRARNAIGAMACGAQSDASAPAILRRAAAGEIQTLLLHRAGELVTHPQRELIERALEATPNVIAIDTFPSWITERASVVLPGALFFETEGSMASVDGRLETLTQGNQPPGDAQEDWRLIVTLAEACGAGDSFDSIDDLFTAMRESWPGAPIFRLRDLRLEGPGEESPQRPQPVIRLRTRPDFKLRFNGREPGAARAKANPPDSLRLLWFDSIQGEDHLASRAGEFAELRPECAIELNPADAAKLGLGEGARVRVSGCANAARLAFNDSLPPGVAFGAANALGLRLPADAEGLPAIALEPAPEEA